MAAIDFSNGSSSFLLENDSDVYVKRTEFDMCQRPEANTLYVEKIRHVDGDKNLYLVHAEDVLIGESIYEANGNYEAYRAN